MFSNLKALASKLSVGGLETRVKQKVKAFIARL